MEKLTKDQSKAFVFESLSNYSKFQKWRLGQSYFNTLYTMHPEIANEVRGTEYSPYYDDKIIDKFLDYITL